MYVCTYVADISLTTIHQAFFDSIQDHLLGTEDTAWALDKKVSAITTENLRAQLIKTIQEFNLNQKVDTQY